MARRRTTGRAAARAASSLLNTPTPKPHDSDEEMQDAPSGRMTPQDDEAEEQEEEGMDGDEEDDGGPMTPRNGSEVPSRNATPFRGGRPSIVPQKRRAGRPPKAKPPGWDDNDDGESRDGASDVGTPRRRGGFRGGRGFGGGRWGKAKGGPSHVSQVPLDKEGNMANVKDDEVELPEDPEGETKVDKLGRLKDGREYRVRVFTISGKGERLYMLSTEPARCIGFRDSYLFFQKHPLLFKIILPEDAKRDLIDRNIIPHSYKGRAIGVVTARSVFREFGSQIIIGGKKIIDDYQVAAARANGDVEGDLAVPDDRLPGSGQGYDKNRYVAWFGASSVYHSGVPTVPLPNGKAADGKKRKVHVTGANWMFEHAREASRFNTTLTQNRRQNLTGIYEPHTNVMHYPKIMQPTHMKWERLPTPPCTSPSSLSSSSPTKPLKQPINGISTTFHQTNDLTEDTIENIKSPTTSNPSATTTTIFPPTNPVFTRTFLVADTYYLNPPISNLGIPGPDGAVYDPIQGPGLSDVSEDVLAELPADCQREFLRAREVEGKWREGWGGEDVGGSRGTLRISYTS